MTTQASNTDATRIQPLPGWGDGRQNDITSTKWHRSLTFLHSFSGAPIPDGLAFVVAEHQGVGSLYEFPDEDYV
jgi:hypothetical protein